MEKGDNKRKISAMQIFPVALNSSRNSTSWVSLKNESHASGSGYNIDYLVIQKPKSRSSLRKVTSYLSLHALPWQIFTAATVCLNYFLISYGYFFVRPETSFTWQFYVSVTCDVFFALDAIFAITVYVKTRSAMTRIEKSRSIFRLAFDSLLSLPCPYIFLIANSDVQSVTYISLRGIAFLRLYRLRTLFRRCEKTVCRCRFFVFYAKYFCYVFLAQHGLACFWYLLARPITSAQTISTSWAENLRAIYHPTTTEEWYFLSNYAVLSGLMRCGFGDVLPTNSYEKILSVVGMCFGVLFSSLYVSSLILLLLNCARQKYKLEKQVGTILKTKKSGGDLSERVLKYFGIFWSKKLGILDAEGLSLLPQELNNKTSYHVNGNLLRNSVLLGDKSEEFLRRISSLMRHEFYSAGQNIYSEREIKNKMVIVKGGTVDVLSEEDHQTPIISFGPGTCLGEVSLLLCLPAVITLRAATYTELQVLYSKDFYGIAPNYPDIFYNIRKATLKRIQRCRPAGERKGGSALKELKEMLLRPGTPAAPDASSQILSLYRYHDNLNRAVSRFKTAKFPYVFNGEAKQMLAWEFFIVVCVLFLAVTFPYYVAYERAFPMWFEIVSDFVYVIFVVDVYVLVTTSIVKRGYVLTTFKKILDARMDTVGFHLDVFAAFYVEAFSYLMEEDVDRFYYLFKLNRLLKVYRVSTLCTRLENILMTNSAAIAFAKYIIYTLLLVYWFSALLYFQTCYYDSCLKSGWFIREIITDVQSRILTATLKGKVLLSLYFGLSGSLAIGTGDILSSNFQDMGFILCGLLLGSLILGYCISGLACRLHLRLKTLCAFNEKLSPLKFYIKDRMLGDKLESRIASYLNSQWHYDGAYSFLNERALLHNVPGFLQSAIQMQERSDALKKIHVFKDLDASFFNYLVLHSDTVVLPPNENFKNFGCISRDMYVILKGYCLMQSDSNEYKTLGPNKAIGFSSLLFGLPSLHNVFTLTDCVLVHVNVATFNRALWSVPGLHRDVYECRRAIVKKFEASFEVKMIESPQFGRKRKKARKRPSEKGGRSSFINTYKYCLYTGESYSHLSNRASRICFLKYLLMPICILPYGRFLKIWTAVRLTITLLVAFGVPLQYILSPYRPEIHYVLFVIDLFAYVDMYLKLHVGYYGEFNQLVLHPWKTAEHYLKGPFVIDLAIWFPLPACIQLLNRTHTEGHSAFSHTLSPHVFHCSVLLIRVLDVYRLPLAFNYMKHCSCLNVLKYTLYVALYIHWWSAFIISRTCKYLHSSDLISDPKSLGMIPVGADTYKLYCKEQTWIAASAHRNYSNFMDVYGLAAYWTTSNMVGMGFGDIHAQNEEEIVVSILIVLSGTLYFGYVLASIVSRAIVTRQILFEYEEKLLRLIGYMGQERIDKDFQSKVREYVNYKWTKTRGVEIHDVLSKFYGSLHEEALLQLYEDTLRHVPMFENVDQSFFKVLGKDLREQYFLQDQMVIKVNDIAEDIFIVHKGMVEILSPHNVIPITIGRGGVFGNVFEAEISLCGITVRALKDLDVLCLRVETFRQIIKDYPFVQKKIGMFGRNQVHKHFAIPNTFVNEDETYFSKKNNYWIDRHALSVSSKKSFIGSCRASFTQKSYIYNIVSCTVLFSAYCNCLLTTYQFCFQQFTSQLLIVAIFIDVIFLLKFILEINNPSYRTQVYASFWDRCLHRKWNRTLDFLANLPFSYSLLFLPFISGSRANFYFSIWRCTTLLRVYYIIRFLHTYKNRLMLNRFYLELSVFCVCFSLICHLCACVWYLLACPFKKCTALPWKADAPHELYLTSLYFIISVFTGTGPGDIVPETKVQMAFVIAAMIGSKIYLGYLIAQFVTILRCGNLFLTKYEAMAYEVKNYFLNMGVRNRQLGDAWNYLCSLWKRRQGFQVPELIVELPKTLKIEVLNSVYGALLKESYIFSQTEKDFIRQLTPLVTIQTYFPSNYIVRDGAVDTCMYFIHRGDVEILSINQNLNETIHEVLHATEVFGIVQGLFKEIPHHFSFRALTVTDIVMLKLSDWEHLLTYFPRSKEIIYQRVDEIYYTI